MSPESTADNFNNETRLALMEQSINHMNQKLDQSLQQINQTFQRFESRFDKIDDRFDKIDERFEKVDREIRANFFWTLGVIGAVFAVVAHALHWF